MAMNIENVVKRLSDDELVGLIRTARDDETLLVALTELSARNSPRTIEVFREILDDPARSLAAKRAVAALIGTGNVLEIQSLLLPHLSSRDSVLFSRVARALARLGDHTALQRLETAKPPSEPVAIRALEFAKTLLAYRLRLDKHRIPPPADTVLLRVNEPTPFRIEMVDAETLKNALSRMRSGLPELAEPPAAAVKLTCDRTELLLLVTAEFASPAAWATLRERPALPLILLQKDEVMGSYFLAGYMFTQPSRSRNQIEVLGTRPTGRLIYAGKAQPSPKGLSFSLRAVNSRYVGAIDVAGEYDATQRTFSFSRALANTFPVPGQQKSAQPQKAKPPTGDRD
jgi:hypothetical protein